MTEETGGRSVPLNLDEIVKMLFLLSDTLTVRMINSLFGKDFPLNAKVTVEGNELHRFDQTGQKVESLRTDLIITINEEKFHVEIQTENDGTMAIRLFEYGFMIAIKKIKSCIKSSKKILDIEYPKQYVIYLEKNRSIPKEEIKANVRLWDGEVKEYKVPLMRYWTETVDTLEAKKLEPLIPLQVFNIRKNLMNIAKSNKSDEEKEKATEEELNKMIDIYKTVSEKIRELVEEKGLLTIFNADEMLYAMQHLSSYLYSKCNVYEKIEKEAIKVQESMFSFTKMLNKARIEDRKETANRMFLNREKIKKIREYSKLPDEDLASVLRELPIEIQAKYTMLNI